MILSVSRRTDIPNYYSQWFYNRLREGFLYVRNPMNAHQISRINLSPEEVDCIVFWTKNPENMLDSLSELSGYPYYFQFTLTGYGQKIEPSLPDKKTRLISIFQELSKSIGHERVIWRYDPILLNGAYTVKYHLKAFKEIAECLRGYTDKVVISFVDFYTKTKRNMELLQIRSFAEEEIFELALGMAKTAEMNHMMIESCAEKIDLQEIGIAHGSCIDQKLIERLAGCKLRGNKDRNQREECGCIESVEVGAYDTCGNGCKYCYANLSGEMVRRNMKLYDVNSPLLCGVVGEGDVITKRKVKSKKAL